MKRLTKQMFCTLLLALGIISAIQVAQAQVTLDQTCVVNILNRTIQVSPDGSWALPNVPSTLGQVRARATCIRYGETISGASGYFNIISNSINPVPTIDFGNNTPVPVSMQITQPTNTSINKIGGTAQLQVMATFPDNSVVDVTAASNGINYISSNPAVASISTSGLITANAAGTVLITARKDEVASFVKINVAASGSVSSMHDGIPDSYKLANHLNLQDPLVAQEDPDQDNLTNLQEFTLGTDPNNPDTDGEGIKDGDEVNAVLSNMLKGVLTHYKTNPLNPDTDGDGVDDLTEINTGFNPLDPSDHGGRLFSSLQITPANPTLVYNTMYNEANQQLKVLGVRADGTTEDITSSSTGTSFSSSDLSVISFGGVDGLIFAGKTGTATVTAKNGNNTVTTTITVTSFSPIPLAYIPIPGHANDVDVSGNYAYVAAGSAGLQVINVSNPNQPVIVGSYDTNGTAIDVKVMGNVAYVADGEDGMQIFDVTTPSSPKLLASYATAGFTQAVKVDSQFAYLANGNGGVEIVDVHTPTRPLSLSVISELSNALGVDVSGTNLVAVSDQSLYVVDITDRLNPVLHGSISIGPVQNVALRDNFAYVAAYTSGYQVVDISNPDAPVIDSQDATFYPFDVKLNDDFAFFAEVHFVNAAPYVNIVNPANAAYEGYIDFKQFNDDNGTGVAVDANYLYLTDAQDIAKYAANGTTHFMVGQYRQVVDNGGVAPTIQYSNLQQDSIVVEGKSVNMLVNAQDDIGVKSVSFYINGQLAYVDTTTPYQYPMYVPYGTQGSTISISAVASDFGGNTTSTSSLTLLVQHDTDKDGLSDNQENVLGTNPKNPDSDGDGLQDGDEVDRRTNPLNTDTDGDTYPDGVEVQNGTDPLNPDITPPTIASTTPADKSTDIPENNPIIITADKPLTSRFIKPSTVTVYEGTLQGAATVSGSVTWSSDGMSVIFTPNTVLKHNTTYEVVIQGIKDLAGNKLVNPYSFTYTTGYTVDTTPPTVLNVDPAPSSTNIPVNAQIAVMFDKPLDKTSISTANVYLTDVTGGYQQIQSVVNISADGQTLYIIPGAGLSVGHEYYLTLTNAIKSLFGVPLNYANYYFTTGFQIESAPPKLIGSSISNNADNLPLNPQIQLKFDEVISAASLSNVTLSEAGNGVTIVRNLNADHTILTLSLLQPLTANTSYSINVQGVEDISGNVLSKPITLSFTTGTAADTVHPTLIEYSPINGISNVGINSQLQLSFDEIINPVSVTTDSIALVANNYYGVRVKTTATFSSDGKSITLQPVTPLLPNTQYYVYLSNYSTVTDLAGNTLGYNSWSFSTGQTANTLTPVISSGNVQNGETGLPINSDFRFKFDEPVTPSSVLNGVKLTANGVAVAGTASLAADGETIIFNPTNPLAANTQYTLTLSGITDYVGNTLATVTESVTTGATADTTPLTFYVTPSWSSFNIPLTSPIQVVFNKQIDPTSINGIYLTSNIGNGNIAGTSVLGADGKTVTFTPNSPLPANAQVNVNVYGVLDISGKNAANSYSYFDTTATNTDTTAPQLLSVAPVDGALNVAVNAPVVLTFSKALNPSTVNSTTLALFENGAQVNPTIGISADNRTVTLNASLSGNTLVSVILTSGIKDINGNSLTDTVKAFTTAASEATGNPSIVSAYPASGAYGVSTTNTIVLYANKPLLTSSVLNSLYVAQNGSLVAGNIQVIGDGSTIEFTPTKPWSKGSNIEIFLENTATDLNGDPLNNFYASFRTEDDPLSTAPTVIAEYPVSYSNNVPLNTVIDLQFNEPLDPTTITTANFSLLDNTNGDTPVAFTVTPLKGNTVVRITPTANLVAQHAYYVGVLKGVKDSNDIATTLNSNALWYFTTGQVTDTVIPQVVSLTPQDGAVNVGINTRVDIRFNEAMNPISFLPDNPEQPLAQITTANANALTYSYVFSNNNTQVSYVPNQPWPVSSSVTLKVSEPQDYAGNTVQSISHTFQTGNGPILTAPVITNWSFAAGATNVPVNAVFDVQISEPIDPVTLNSSTFYLYDDTIYANVAASISLSADNRTLSLVPTLALAAGHQYILYVSNITDINGNALNNFYYQNQRFTTGFSPDTLAPQVAGFSFNSAQTGLPINTQLQVQFDGPIDPATLTGVQLLQGSNVIPTATQISTDHTSVTLLLNQPLQANTSYTMSVQGVKDTSGNVLTTAVTRSFTTGTAADLLVASLQTYSPGYYASNIPTNAQVVLTFNDVINPLSVTKDSIRFNDNTSGQLIAYAVSFSADGKTLTLQPKQLLPANHSFSLYTSYYAALHGISGNQVSYAYTYFTTGSIANSLMPTVAGSNLQNNETGVAVNSKFRFVLDEQVTAASVANSVILTVNGVQVAGTASLGSDNQTITFTPASPLQPNSKYTLQISKLTDLTGNVVAPVTEQFTTGSAADTSNLTFYVSPGYNAFNIPVSTPIVITFNKAIDPTTLSGISVSVSGYNGLIGGSTAVSADGKSVTFTPASPLPGNKQIYINVAVQDLTGNAVNSSSYFYTGPSTDTTLPKLLSISPANNAINVSTANPIVLTFSKSLNQATVNNQTIGLFANGNLIQPNFSYSADNRTVTLTASIPASSVVSVVLTDAVKDLNGNSLADTVEVFTTSAAINTSTPSITAAYPASGASGVSVDNIIVIYSNKTLNPATVNGAIHVVQNGVVINGSTQVLGDGSTIEFTPAQPWSKQALIEVTLDSTATDLNGVALTSHYSSFRTVEDPALTAPYVIASNPSGYSTNFPLNGVIDLQFNEALDPTTIIATNFYLTEVNTNQSITFSLSALKGNRVVRITPTSNLSNAQSYYFGVHGGVKDSSGVVISSSWNSYFTAGQNTDSITPKVQALVPTNGSTNVAINSRVDMGFNEPMDPISFLTDNADIPLAQITASGDARTYSLSFSNNNTQVSYLPHLPWPVNSSATITVSTPEDNAGNTVSSATSTFETGNGPDFTPVSISNWGFVSGATGVPVNSIFKVQLNKPIDPLSLSSSSFYLQNNTAGIKVAAAISASTDGKTITLVPTQALTASNNYYLYVYGIYDLAGNQLSYYYNTESFTTGSNSDTTAPVIAGYSFTNGASGLPINVELQVKFDNPVDISTLTGIQLSQNGKSIVVTPQISADFTTVTLALSELLQPNTAYTMTVQGVKDTSGNVLAKTDSRNFTTGISADLTNASLVTYSPAVGATVGTNSEIVLTFNDVLNPLSLSTDSIALYDPDGQRLATNQSLSTDGKTVTLVPSSLLKANYEYYVYISNWAPLYDQSGNKANFVGFYILTSAGTNQQTPSVSTSSLQNGATGVAVNGSFSFTLSEPISSPSVIGSITLQDNGVTIAGTASLGSDNETVTFTPTQPLAANTAYTLKISGLTDYQGNVLSTITDTFTTGAAVAAQVSPGFYVTPGWNSFNINVNAVINVTFNEVVDPTTLGGIYLTGNGINGQIASTVTLSTDGTVATVTPVAPLPANTQVYVNVYGVKDLNGNNINTYSMFYTGINTDTTPPKLLAITPNSGAFNVADNSPVVLTFSKSLNQSSVNSQTLSLYANGGLINPSYSFSADNRTVTLNANLPASSIVSVLLTNGINDLNGNALAETVEVFTTAAATNTSNPSIIAVYPGNGASQVLPDNKIVMYSNKPLDSNSVQSAFQVKQNGVTATGNLQVLGDGRTLEFTPTNPWSKQATITFGLSTAATDLNGDALNNFSSSFTTVDDPSLTAPVVYALNPINGGSLPVNGVIDLQFNEPLDPSTVNTNTFILTDTTSSPYQSVPVTVTSLKNNVVVRLTPNAKLTLGHQYYIGVLLGVKDSTEVASTMNYSYYWSFTATATDGITPQVTALSPFDQATNVGINSKVDIVFNEAINPLSFLPDDGVTPLAQVPNGNDWRGYSLTFSNGNTQVSYIPHQPWPAESTVKLTVSGEEDNVGNTVKPLTHTFYTADGPDFSAPYVSQWSYTNNATNVPVNAVFQLQMNKSIDQITLNTGSFYLHDTVTNQNVAANVSVSADGTTLTLVPQAALSVYRQYYLQINNVLDLSGNNSGSPYQYFTTGGAADTSAPQIIGFNINNGETGVPTNTLLKVQFNKPISPVELSGVQLLQNGVNVNGAIVNGEVITVAPQISNDFTTVSLILNEPLQPNTTYVLQVQGIQDTSNNVFSGTTNRTFTTGVGVDLLNAGLVSYSPANNAGNVPLNTNIVLTFNERISPISLNGNGIWLRDNTNNAYIAVNSNISADGKTVTLIPQSNLVANRSYDVLVNWYNYSYPVVDVAGNPLNNTYWTFTTGNTLNQLPPVISGENIANGATGIAVNSKIRFVLDEPVTDSSVVNSILLQENGVTVSGTVTLASDNQTILFTPTYSLLANTTYNLVISGITDYTGNTLQTVNSTFTTGATADTSNLTFYVNPGLNSFDIPVTTPITIIFNKQIDPTSLGGITVTANGYNGQIAGSAKLGADGQSVIFTPVSPLPGNAQIYVNVNGVLDFIGNVVNANSYFYTGVNATDTTPPQLTAITPNDGSVNVANTNSIVLTFSKSLNQGTVTNQSVTLFANGVDISPSISFSADNRTVVLNASIPASSVISVVLTHDIKDLNGNPLADTVKTFTTAAATNNNTTNIATAYPANSAYGVLTDNNILLYANKPLQASSVQKALHIVQNGSLVTGSTKVIGDGSAIEFIPSQPWAKQALVQVFLDSTAIDINGNGIQAYQGSFRTTDDPALTAPTVIALSPVNGGSLPVNGVIDLQFNEPLDPATVNASTFVLHDNSVNPAQQITLEVAALKSNNVVRLTPTTPLTVGDQYYIGVRSGVLDASEVASSLNYDYYWSFIATAKDTITPQVLALSPTNGAENVGINGRVDLQFNEAMDTISFLPDDGVSPLAQIYNGNDARTGSFYFSNGNTQVAYIPNAPWLPNTSVNLTISGFEDLAGNSLQNLTHTFTTAAGADFNPPQVVNWSFVANATNVPVNTVFQITVNKPMDPITVNTSSFYLHDNNTGQNVAATTSVSAGGQTLTLVPSQALTPNHQYYLQINSALDLSGNSIGSPYQYLTTGSQTDTTPPQISGYNVSNGQTGVATNVQLQVQFNKAINGVTLGNVLLSQNGNNILITPQLSGDKTTLTLLLKQPLNTNTQYTLTVQGVQDTSGNALAAASTVSFTTGGSADLLSGALVNYSPSNGANNVPLNSQIVLTFNDIINPLSLNGNGIWLRDSSNNNVQIAVTNALSSDGKTLTLTPSSALPANHNYYLFINWYNFNYPVIDDSGNSLAGNYFSFNSAAQ